MKSTTFALGSLMAATIAVAQPHHKHQGFHQKRDSAPVVWKTEWDYVTETIPVTTTIWVPEGYVPPTTAPTSPSSAFASPSSSASQVPAQFFEPAAATSSSSSVYVAPPAPAATRSASEAPVYVAPVETSTTPVADPAPATTEAAAPVVVETPTPTPEPTTAAATAAPAPASSSAAASSESSSTSSSGYSGECAAGSACTGDMTYYDTALGACGWTNDGTTEKVVALSHLLMGTQSNGNPYCGKTITIEHGGKTTTAKVVDKCMGCEPYAIDLSDAAFQDLADMGVGRTTATWYIN